MRLTTPPQKTTACYRNYSSTTCGPVGNSSKTAGTMATADESPLQEVRSSNQGFLGPQTTIRLGAWNVRTMFETSKTAQVINEMQNYNLDFPCVSECKWTGSGRKVTCDIWINHPFLRERQCALQWCQPLWETDKRPALKWSGNPSAIG